MRAAWLSLGLLGWAGAASALSCLPVTVESLYTQAAQSELSYVPVVGRLGEVELELDPPEPGGFGASGRGTAVFTGGYLTARGRLVSWSTAVRVEVTCAGSWCGSPPSRERFLGFLRAEQGVYHFTSSACLSVIFEPTDADVARLKACMRGADCRFEL